MLNLIHLENTSSLCYNLDMIPNTDLVAITQRNVAIVEAMIRNDSAYIRSNQVEKALIKYINKYKLNYSVSDFKQYDKYLEAIEAVICESERKGHGDKVSRNGLDHLLWYYYKGRV